MPFKQLGLFSSLVKGVEAMGYKDPTPIQLRAIPAVLAGRDLIASAQTGTGKTAAFALPILNRLGPHKAGSPRVLVLEPTRELAAQVETAFRDFGRFTDIKTTVLFGGVGYGKQRQDLRQGSDIVVATVGRLLDFLQEKSLRLDQIEILVLDEVDRMLDMGFIKDVKRIIGMCPPKRQTLFFSATVPPEIEEVAQFALKNPERIEIGRARSVNESVNHAIYPISFELKFTLLLALLEKIDFQSVIIFSRTKHGADKIARKLKSANHSVAVLHANRSQNQRLEALEGFKSGRYEVMVATDIAARGIDVQGVSHVINYDVPENPEDYVHRIGRTGRAMAVGDAFMLATPEDSRDVRDIERFIGSKIPQLKLDGFDYNQKSIQPQRQGQGGPGQGAAGGQPGAQPSGEPQELTRFQRRKQHQYSPNHPRAFGGGDPKHHSKGKPGSHWRTRSGR
ncbi:DEAD/DEAH box helicase [Nibricoccus sp. IMCC34717]|uniref:DEAD/DEAH box helicase n=1 Tax=Nibricoccus sp. IMCC34717 TaxID=3034021 RepID=UPI00384CA704